MKTIICDKCGRTVHPDEKGDAMHLQGINLLKGFVELDLCGDCYQLLDNWLAEAPDGTVKVYKKSL